MVHRRDFMKMAGMAAGAALLPRQAVAQQPPLSERLQPVWDFMRQLQADGKLLLPGYVGIVAQGDEVSADMAGTRALGGTVPMTRDTIFRIQSMTKAITAAAVLMLVEEGKLSLDETVDRLLPELSNRQVLKRIDGPLDETVPAERPITIRDIMQFTFGFGLLFEQDFPIQKQINALQLTNDFPQPFTPHEPDEWMRRLGTLPLMHQPGETWMYNTGSLVQGVLVRRASGQSFDAFLEERLFGPLGMVDTAFWVPPQKLSRFADGGYTTDQQTGKVSTFDTAASSEWAKPPAFPSGASGLVSTADDYLAFARMLLGKGTYQGRRYLSEASVTALSTNRLTPQQMADVAFLPGFFEANGWGYGVEVYIRPDAVSATPGRYGWNGGYGTSWFNDPQRGIAGVMLTQSVDFLFAPQQQDFWQKLFAAAEA